MRELLTPKFLVLLLIGLVVRILLIPNLGFEFDTVVTQYRWGTDALQMGFTNFWSNYTQFLDYLPGAVVFSMLIRIISGIFSPEAQAFVIVLKIFNLFIDFALLIVIARWLKSLHKVGNNVANWTSYLVWLSPAVLVVSAFWGQFDSLILLLIITSLWLALNRKKYFWGGAILALAITLKLQPVLLLPIIFLGILLLSKLKKTFIFAVGMVAVLVLLNIVPFLLNLDRSLFVFGQPFLRSPMITNGAHTFWELFYPMFTQPADIVLALGNFKLSVSNVALLAFLASLAVTVWFFIKQKANLTFAKILLGIQFLNMSYFLFMMNMHSRYGYFPIILSLMTLPLLLEFIENRWQRAATIMLTVLFHLAFTVNQLTVYNVFYGDKLPRWLNSILGMWELNILDATIYFFFWLNLLIILFLKRRKSDIV